MGTKRYSIFISSTYEDLKVERQAVQDAVLAAGDFPVQMESFPASDQDQFEFIKGLIDGSDFYILVIAGRYGALQANGKSFTEMEYDYAVSKNIPILVMLHSDPENISNANSEKILAAVEALDRFKKKASTGRMWKKWSNAGDLKHAVRDAIDHAKIAKPAVGWVRGDTISSTEALGELNEIRKENAKYKELFGKIDNMPEFLALPEITESIEIRLLSLHYTPTFSSSGATGSSAVIMCSWLDAFPYFLQSLQWTRSDHEGELYYSRINDEKSCRLFGEKLASEFANFDVSGLFMVSLTCFERLASYFIEAGLMNEEGPNAEPFTPLGKQIARRGLISQGRTFQIIDGEIRRNDF